MPDVGCAGILVEDTFCGPMPTLPMEGALLTLDEMPVRAGGCAANVAIDLAKQGISVDVVGCIGRDRAADLLLHTFEAYGIGCSKVSHVDTYRTSRTIILLVKGQDRRYLHMVGANRAFAAAHIPCDWLRRLKVFYLGGLFALPGIDVAELAALLKACRNENVMTVVDVVVPQGFQGMTQLREILPFIDVFVPNEDEARAFTGASDPFAQLRSLQSAGANTVIITQGNKGAVAARAREAWSCGAHELDIVDPSGSGDAFTSGVIFSLLRGWDMPQTLRYASAIGASATRATGTTDAVFSAAEAEAFIAEHSLTVTERSWPWT